MKTEGHTWDPGSPTVARLYNHAIGGKDSYAADRLALAELTEILPHLKTATRANAAFVRRACRTVAQHGIRQFLDLGCGLPDGPSVLQTASEFQPQCRVVYVDDDPQVAAHGRALLEEGDHARMVEADARDYHRVLHSTDILDINEPVAVIVAAIAHFWDDPISVISGYAAALPTGSFLIFSHACGEDLPPHVLDRATVVYNKVAPFYPRTRKQILDILSGLETVHPGLVEASRWRPESDLEALAEDVGNAQFLVALSEIP